MDLKIKKTENRIKEWYQFYGGDVYVSFSGGKDSTVLLDIARKIYPSIDAVYIDTGLEYPELREFVKTIDNVTWLKPEINFKKVIQKYGYPIISKEVALKIEETRHKPDGYASQSFDINSDKIKKYGLRYYLGKYKYLLNAPFKISNKCCDVMKKKPAKKYEKQTGKHPITGIMACESQVRKTEWKLNGCNAFDKKRPSSQPLSFWTEQDVLEYIFKNNVSYASVYGDVLLNNNKYYTTKCKRTGCIFCGFGCHLEKEPNRFQMLKQTHPKMWEYCMKPLEDGGMGIRKVMEYINVPIE